MLSCELQCLSSTEHLEQLYTGFGLLARKRLISLRVRRAAEYSSRPYSTPLLHADVRGESVPGGGLRLTFDLEDHGSLPPAARVEGTDFLFKRTYDPSVVSAGRTSYRTLPLGLNYSVMDSEGFGLRRALWARNPRDFATMIVRHSRWLSRAIPLQQSIAACSARRFEGVPRLDVVPRVLLMARVWDPDRTPAFKAERLEINSMRAECVRHLRNAFPSLFWGGLARDPHAMRHYRDCVVPNDHVSHKHAYVELMHQSSICVATAGLRGSIGWKFAEYVAGAKAIVTETTNVRIPGTFGPPTNCLVFRNPQDCVECVGTLVDSPGRRLEMMRANAAYYHAFVRPDALVWNALTTALLSASQEASAADLPLRGLTAAG
ncbi:MAG: hypothetical protein EHM55_01605 [Acidobacteria bacterium]|nr:MAG: hypothetical protein EHM55_01605 [Acidobacteriota bacterium]